MQKNISLLVATLFAFFISLSASEAANTEEDIIGKWQGEDNHVLEFIEDGTLVAYKGERRGTFEKYKILSDGRLKIENQEVGAVFIAKVRISEKELFMQNASRGIEKEDRFIKVTESSINEGRKLFTGEKPFAKNIGSPCIACHRFGDIGTGKTGGVIRIRKDRRTFRLLDSERRGHPKYYIENLTQEEIDYLRIFFINYCCSKTS